VSEPTERQTDNRWSDRRVLSAFVRLAILATPLVAALAVLRVVDELLVPSSWPVWAGLLVAVPIALAVSFVGERASRRFLPLPALLRMTMLFPDQAPSRLAVARRAASKDQLEKMLAARDAGPQHAAQTMVALIAALSAHDRRTRGHSERVRVFTDIVSDELGLAPRDRDRLRWAALLHDIGKLEIAAGVLNKPSKLNESEWQRMRMHPVFGAELCAPLLEWLGPWGKGIIEHHERYDGTGYPYGLAQEGISLAGRVIGVVDAYETMTAARAYKKPSTTRAAREELARCAGTHFDPVVVRAFLAVSLPRVMWATGPLALVTHLPYMRELQHIGTQIATASGASVAGAAGATALAVGAAVAVPLSAAASVLPGADTARPAASSAWSTRTKR